MKVKVGNTLSEEKNITGGAVQGSVLGVLDHNAVLEFIDEDLEADKTEIYKYVDDLTLDEVISKDIECVIDNSGPIGTQKGFDLLNEKCEEKGLKVNEKKTQLISIFSSKNDTTAWLKTKDGSIMYSQETFKLLDRAGSKSFVIRKLSTLKIDKKTLVKYILFNCTLHFGVYFGNLWLNVNSI